MKCIIIIVVTFCDGKRQVDFLFFSLATISFLFTVLAFSLFWPLISYFFRLFVWSVFPSSYFLPNASLPFILVSVILAIFWSSCLLTICICFEILHPVHQSFSQPTFWHPVYVPVEFCSFIIKCIINNLNNYLFNLLSIYDNILSLINHHYYVNNE